MQIQIWLLAVCVQKKATWTTTCPTSLTITGATNPTSVQLKGPQPIWVFAEIPSITTSNTPETRQLFTYLDDSMFLWRKQIHLALIKSDTCVHYATEQVLSTGDFSQAFFDVGDNAVVCCQEHGQLLGLFYQAGVWEMLQHLCSPAKKRATISRSQLPTSRDKAVRCAELQLSSCMVVSVQTTTLLIKVINLIFSNYKSVSLWYLLYVA